MRRDDDRSNAVPLIFLSILFGIGAFICFMAAANAKIRGAGPNGDEGDEVAQSMAILGAALSSVPITTVTYYRCIKPMLHRRSAEEQPLLAARPAMPATRPATTLFSLATEQELREVKGADTSKAGPANAQP